MKNLGQFFQDGNREFSATRLAFLAWIFGALIIWGAGSFQAKEMQKVPESVIALIGILMTGKAVQRFGETPETKATTEPQAAGYSKTTDSSPADNGAASIPASIAPSR